MLKQAQSEPNQAAGKLKQSKSESNQAAGMLKQSKSESNQAAGKLKQSKSELSHAEAKNDGHHVFCAHFLANVSCVIDSRCACGSNR